MRIGIDGTPLMIPFHCGQRHYLENLLFNLAKIDKKNPYLIFASKKIKIPKQKNFFLVLVPDLPVFKRQILIPLAAAKQRLDVFHCPDVIGSIFLKHPKTIITIHDLGPSVSYPAWLESPKYSFMKCYNNFVKKFTIKNSSHLITASKTVASEVSKKYLQPKIPITVVYEGVGKEFKQMKKVKKGNYFLAMTDFSPRKNIERTLKAHCNFITKTSRKIPLKVIVSTSYPKSIILSRARKLGTEKFIKILENVSLTQLVKLYNQAICFLYPSLYEGFGLPILEAMACGCPVITSNYGAMREVADNAALLVNPKSTYELTSAMVRLVNDKELAQKLRNKGLKRVKEFSWEETARKTLEVYDEIYKK